MAPPHSSPSPLSSSASPSAATSAVEYSKVRSTDPEDPTFEIEDPKAPSKNFYGKAPASPPPFLHDRCSRSALACLAAIIAGTCLLLLFGIHVLTKPALPARKPDSNAIPAALSPNPPPVEAFSPSYSSPSSSPSISSPSPSPSSPSSPSPSPTATGPGVVLSLTSLCNATQDSGFCIETLGSFPRSDGEAASLTDLTGYVVSAAMEAVNRTYLLGRDLFETRNGTRGELAVLQDCVELLDQSMDALKDSRDLLQHLDVASRGQVMDVRVGLSAAYTDQDTCWDEFGDLGGGKVADRMTKEGGGIAPLLSLALSFALTVQNHSPATVYIPLLAPSPSP